LHDELLNCFSGINKFKDEVNLIRRSKIMKYIMKVRMSVERGNEALSDPQFGHKMSELLAEIKAEAAYFSTIDGQRGAYVIVNMNDASEIPAIAEPFFLWLDADIEFLPAMRPEDLAKAGPSIGAVVNKWGRK
jgi:hypothetical protein